MAGLTPYLYMMQGGGAAPQAQGTNAPVPPGAGMPQQQGNANLQQLYALLAALGGNFGQGQGPQQASQQQRFQSFGPQQQPQVGGAQATPGVGAGLGVAPMLGASPAGASGGAPQNGGNPTYGNLSWSQFKLPTGDTGYQAAGRDGSGYYYGPDQTLYKDSYQGEVHANDLGNAVGNVGQYFKNYR